MLSKKKKFGWMKCEMKISACFKKQVLQQMLWNQRINFFNRICFFYVGETCHLVSITVSHTFSILSLGDEKPLLQFSVFHISTGKTRFLQQRLIVRMETKQNCAPFYPCVVSCDHHCIISLDREARYAPLNYTV